MNLIHFWCHYGERDAETLRRMAVAQETWKQFPRSFEIQSFKRYQCWDTGGPSVAFVQDILEGAMNYCGQDDVIFLTNADVGFIPGTVEALRKADVENNPIHIRKRNFQVIPFNTITDGGDYPGMDACAFTAGWWRDHRYSYPDMLFGRQHWDSCLRNLIRKHGGVEVRDVMWHEEHPSLWQTKACHRQNLYNERLLCGWIAKNGGSEQDHLYTNEELGFR